MSVLTKEYEDAISIAMVSEPGSGAPTPGCPRLSECLLIYYARKKEFGCRQNDDDDNNNNAERKESKSTFLSAPTWRRPGLVDRHSPSGDPGGFYSSLLGTLLQRTPLP